MLEVDAVGLDVMDRKLLEAVIEKFGGGPVGLDNLAAAIGEERDTIEDVLEPYLIQQGYLAAHAARPRRDERRVPAFRSRAARARRHIGFVGREVDEYCCTDQPTGQEARLAREIYRWPVRVYYEDTDGGGVVYYANYLKFLERARTEWLRSLGFEQGELAQRHRVLFVVRAVAVEYLKPSLYDDSLQITVEPAKVGAGSIELAQRVLRDARGAGDGERAGRMCGCSGSFRAVRMPQHLSTRIRMRVVNPDRKPGYVGAHADHQRQRAGAARDGGCC